MDMLRKELGRDRAVWTWPASAFWGELGWATTHQELSKEVEPFIRGLSNGEKWLARAQKQKNNWIEQDPDSLATAVGVGGNLFGMGRPKGRVGTKDAVLGVSVA